MPLAPNNEKFAERFLVGCQRQPLAISLALSLIYVAFCSFYIWYSGRIAATLAPSVTDLEQMELAKGIIFVLVTGGLIFLLAFLLLRKVAQMNAKLIAQHEGLVATERIATAGLFATATCHDINNIMSAVRANLELLPHLSPLNKEGVSCVEDALRACNSLNQMVKRLLTVGHEKLPGAIGETDLSRVIRESVAFATSHKRVRNCTVTSDLPDSLPCRVNVSTISRMLLNLILNAADATDERGTIAVRLRQESGTVVIEVHDNGPGIPEQQRHAIFEPFYTTKASGNGLGLLSLKVCAQEHGGTVEITDSELGGACFRITIPR